MRNIHAFLGVLFLVLGAVMLGSCESPAAESAVKSADTQPSGPMQNVTDPNKQTRPETHNTMR